ncbi:MAG: DUF192 domain-containing protein [Leptolyngbyaceae cyanobacterium SL_5_9]|nr:DUF192 domain-containing protein [Leptolyngbyaceae cyanobacterium SL_5_9]NJO75157.1 DUF192 domain-containing protein [Leptolyngbyaceae cyanobacterium RM1_406_9]
MNRLCLLNTSTIGLSVLLLSCTHSPPTEASSPSESNQSPAQTETSQANSGQSLPISAQTIIGNQQIGLEVARTPQQQAMGLMFRSEIPDDQGMLFEFEPARPVSFWMRNVMVPLDIIFLLDGEVQAIAANVPPCTTPTCPTYGPEGAVNQVIELRGGRAAELGLQVGDQIAIEFLQSDAD